MLLINEIFCSIQGESTYAGLPCVFVRVSGCDVGCRWCDTRYAADEPGRNMGLDEIVRAASAYGPRLAEITGGEPLLQAETPALARRLAEAGFTVLVETSGTRDIRPLTAPTVRVMDVKCPASGVAERMRWDNFDDLRATDEIKFVLSDRADFDYALGVMRRFGLTDREGVLFSPVWGELEAGLLSEWILSDAPRARLQLPLHKLIWPADARGR